MFHIRWHKSFNYYYGNVFSTSIAPETNQAINDMLNETRSNHYHASGKYKGILLSNSTFLSELPVFIHERHDKDLVQLAIIDLMQSILLHTHDKCPVLKDSIPLHYQNNNNDSNVESDIINNNDDSTLLSLLLFW